MSPDLLLSRKKPKTVFLIIPNANMSEKICCEGKRRRGKKKKSFHEHNLSLTVTKSIGFTEPRKFNSLAFITKIGLGDLSLSNKAGFGPQLPFL